MTVSKEMMAQIDAEASGLQIEAYLRSGLSYTEFVKEYSEVLARAESDRALLEGAGMDYSKIPLYAAYLEVLSMEHAERVNAEAEVSEARTDFKAAMPQARADKALLMAVGRYVVSRAEGPEPKRVYDWVRKGTGDVDTLNDNIAMVNFMRRWKDLASEVRPGGQTLDEARLSAIESASLSLLKQYGEATAASDVTSEKVDRQARLLTLCVRALREIKLFAQMAFYNDIDRYNRDYALPSRKSADSDELDAEVETVAP